MKLWMRVLWVSMLAAGCAESGSSEVGDVAQGVGSTMTIKGRVFFNDRRDHGLFSARKTQGGAAGTKCGSSGAGCTVNLLAAQYMVVDVIELDRGFFAPTAWNCKAEEVLQSVAVNADGSFTAVVDTTDPCASDALAGNAFALKVRLRYCGDWCVSVGPDDTSTYALYYPGATSDSPLAMSPGQTKVLADMVFAPGGRPLGEANDTAVAASIWASLVDTALTLHRDNGIPFYKEEYGELHYVYPSTATATATTKSATKIVHKKDLDWQTASGWESGSTPAHEYGHVTMLRAWDGDYGFDGVGISAGDSTRAVSQQIAFKEAWAEFVSHAVMVETRACDRASFDDNATTPLPGPLGDGTWWRLNITKSLCDWYDERADDDAALAGGGDHFAAGGLYSMWFNLREMYVHADEYGGDYAGEGLYFCDWVDYYTDVRKPSAAESITDLIYNDNIACYRPAP